MILRPWCARTGQASTKKNGRRNAHWRVGKPPLRVIESTTTATKYRSTVGEERTGLGVSEVRQSGVLLLANVSREGGELCWQCDEINNEAPIQSLRARSRWIRYLCRHGSLLSSPPLTHSLTHCPSYRGYLLIPGPGTAPLPPAGAPLLGLMSCPVSAGAETEAGAPAAGTAAPGCPSPSMLASLPMAAGWGADGEGRVSSVLPQRRYKVGM